MERNPRATFVTAKVDPFFQVAGSMQVKYLVMLVADNPVGTSFAVLRPNFHLLLLTLRFLTTVARTYITVVSAKL